MLIQNNPNNQSISDTFTEALQRNYNLIASVQLGTHHRGSVVPPLPKVGITPKTPKKNDTRSQPDSKQAHRA